MSQLPCVGNHQQCDYRRHRLSATDLAEILGKHFGWKVKPDSLELDYWDPRLSTENPCITLRLAELPGFTLEFEGFHLHSLEETVRRTTATCFEEPWSDEEKGPETKKDA